MGEDENTEPKGLLELGPGNGSAVERIKLESHHLRGGLAQELQEPTSRFSGNQAQLIKFHGVYQQEDRDSRLARKAANQEKAYNFMVRTRIPGGVITAEQYLAHDRLAGQYGNGSLRITTRQGFQLHGVLKGDLKTTIRGVNEALLSTLAACGDVNRNVMTCPAPEGPVQAEVARLAHKIAMHLAPRSKAYHEIWVDGEQVPVDEATARDEVEPIYGPSYLPRKFKVAVAMPGDNCVDIFTQDIGLVAMAPDGALQGFTVLVGGGMGMTHGKSETYPRLAEPLCFVTPDEVIEVVETIVTIQRDYGDRTNRKHARMKYLIEERGIAWFRAETERRLGRFLCAPRPIIWASHDDHLGWRRQSDGNWFLGLFVENGRIKDAPNALFRTGLRAVIDRFRPGIHLTPQQNLLLTAIREEDRPAIEAMLGEYGIATDPQSVGAVRRHALACPALPTCGLALADAERALPDVVTQIEADLADLDLAEEAISVRMTGCPNGCARPYMGDIGFVGRTKDVYNIYVGGDWANTRLTTLYAPSVRVTELAATLRPLFALWKREREPGESFGDFADRFGIDALRAHAEVQQTA
jgi:sulfite reductase (ferredoxin)